MQGPKLPVHVLLLRRAVENRSDTVVRVVRVICRCSSPGCPFQPYEAPGLLGKWNTGYLHTAVFCSTLNGASQSGRQNCIGRSMSVPCANTHHFKPSSLGMASVCAAPHSHWRICPKKHPDTKQDFTSHAPSCQPCPPTYQLNYRVW